MQIQDVMVCMLRSQGRERNISAGGLWLKCGPLTGIVNTLIDNFIRHTLALLCGPLSDPSKQPQSFWGIDSTRCQKCSIGDFDLYRLDSEVFAVFSRRCECCEPPTSPHRKKCFIRQWSWGLRRPMEESKVISWAPSWDNDTLSCSGTKRNSALSIWRVAPGQRRR